MSPARQCHYTGSSGHGDAGLDPRTALPAADIAAAVVINLAARPDRLAAVRAQWKARPALPPLDVYTAVAVGDSEADRVAGCLASHRAVLACAGGPVLVCEDDIVFARIFDWPVRPPPDWQILWLGGQHVTPPEPVLPGWVRPTSLLRSHCYAVRQPHLVADMLAGATRTDPYTSRLPLVQYAQVPFTVGQAAGPSDIDRQVRGRDQFWN